MKIEKRLELEMRGKKSDQVMDLNLDNCRINSDQELEVLTSDFTALESLSMINSNISSLEYFPELPSLRKLELSDNRISGGLEKLQGCAKLSQLSLSGNKIKDFKDLESLKSLRCLKSLDLFNCEVTTSTEEYRAKVFEILDQITYLDGFDRDDNEAEEDSEVEDGEDEDEDDDDDDDDDDGEDEDGEGDEVGLDYLTKENLDDDDEEEEDFDPDADDDDDNVVVEGVEGEDDDDDDDEDEDEEEDDAAAAAAAAAARGQKRKHEEEEEEEDA